MLSICAAYSPVHGVGSHISALSACVNRHMCYTAYPVAFLNVWLWAFPHHTAAEHFADDIIPDGFVLGAVWYGSIARTHLMRSPKLDGRWRSRTTMPVLR